MNVLFIMDPEQGKIIGVAWETEGSVWLRKEDSRKAFHEEEMEGIGSLRKMIRVYGSPYMPMYPAQVNDLRSAFKYIGKSADLVKLLPAAEV